MAAIGTLPVVLGTGIHASRPAASAVGKGGLWACSTHGLIYQTDGSSWTTWATLGAAASGSITASGYTQSTAKMLGRSTASTGAIEEITVGSGLSLSAGSLTATGGAGPTIASGPWYAPWCAPAVPDAKDAEFTGSQLAGMTRVYNSGTPKGTWTEKFSTASYILTASGGNPELDVYAQARTMSVGDYVEIGFSHPTTGANFLGAFVGFADGTTFNNSGSHVVGVFAHNSSGVYRFLMNIWDGYNTRTSDGTIADPYPVGRIVAVRVKYESANTWGMYVSLDGVSWRTVQTNYAKTMTPTHVVFGASMLTTPLTGQPINIEYFRVNS